jgi:NADPH2:quinone reductase
VVEEFVAVRSLSVRDLQTPELEQGQVRVQIKAAGVDFVDALKIEGRYQTKDPLPFVPGAEFAGIVAEIVDGPSDWKIGDRVFGRAP